MQLGHSASNSTSYKPLAPTRFRTIESVPVTFLNVVDFGARGNGTTDDAPAFRRALSVEQTNSNFELYVPEGTYRLDSPIAVPRGFSIRGKGMGQTVLSFAQAPATNVAYMLATGKTTPLPPLGEPIAAGTTRVTFLAPPSLTNGDVYLILNTNDFSFSQYRSYYRAGEFMEVSHQSGEVVSNVAPVFSSYSAGQATRIVKVLPWSGTLSDFSLVCPSGTNVLRGIQISLGRSARIQDVEVSGSAHAAITLDRCYQSEAIGVRTFSKEPDIGLNYGVLVGSSQQCIVRDCEIGSTRHGFCAGSGVGVERIPCRQITVSNSIAYSTLGKQTGLDFHGNSEMSVVLNCKCTNGISLGGDKLRVENCIIGNDTDSGRALVLSEPLGCSFTVRSNLIVAGREFRELIRMSLQASSIRQDGELLFTHNRIHGNGLGIVRGGQPSIGFVSKYEAPGPNNTLVISNNTFVTVPDPQSPSAAIGLKVPEGPRLIVSDNSSLGWTFPMVTLAD